MKQKQYTNESELTAGKCYACMHIDFDLDTGKEYVSAGTFFKYLGEGNSEIDSNAVGEENYYDSLPYADYYVDL